VEERGGVERRREREKWGVRVEEGGGWVVVRGEEGRGEGGMEIVGDKVGVRKVWGGGLRRRVEKSKGGDDLGRGGKMRSG